MALAGCGRDPMTAGSVERDSPEFSIPAVPNRAPIETARLGGNVFDSICHIGNPFLVTGWDLDSQTRFLYFVGPFNGADDGKTHPYLYFAIPAPDRARMTTTLYLDRLDEPELRKHAKPLELGRFQLPHIAGLPADAKETRQLLGEPTHTRRLESGLTRQIFARELCLDQKRLVAAYIDVDDSGRLVAAKGVEHPDRVKWLVSAGRTPQPDESPTWYQDWKPRDGSPQAAAVDFVFSAEGGGAEAARAEPPHDLASVFAEGATIDTSTLTYRTMRYGLDFAEVAVAFTLSNGRNFRGNFELRAVGKKQWQVSGWRP